jgi:HEAT repeat protein
MKRKWLVGLPVLVLLVGVAVYFEPTGVVRGWWHGELFFQGRPTNYWRRALRDDDPAGQVRAAAALKGGGLAAIPVLAAVLNEDRPGDWQAAQERCKAAEILGEMGPEARMAAPMLMTALNDPDPAVRKAIIVTLDKLGVPAEHMVPRLIALLPTSNRIDAIKSLGRYGGAAREAVPALVGLLKDPAADVRWNAAQALGLIGPEARQAVPDLIAALHDEDADVREHGAESLGQVGVASPEVVGALEAACKDPNPRVRRDAVRSLGQFGPAARPALAAVVALRKDDVERVRQAAEIALKRIDPKGEGPKGR